MKIDQTMPHHAVMSWLQQNALTLALLLSPFFCQPLGNPTTLTAAEQKAEPARRTEVETEVPRITWRERQQERQTAVNQLFISPWQENNPDVAEDDPRLALIQSWLAHKFSLRGPRSDEKTPRKSSKMLADYPGDTWASLVIATHHPEKAGAVTAARSVLQAAAGDDSWVAHIQQRVAHEVLCQFCR